MYREKISKLHENISNNGSIVIHSWQLRDPLPEQQLKDLSTKYSLPDSLYEFYKETNGFQLSYTFKDNADFNKKAFGQYETAFDVMWPNENYWQLDGCINILSLEYTLRQDWKDYIWFDTQVKNRINYKGKEYDQLEFEKRLKPFDIFNKSSIAVFLINDKRCEILLGTDHNASFMDYEPLSIDEYVKKVIETEGLIDKRSELFTPKA